MINTNDLMIGSYVEVLGRIATVKERFKDEIFANFIGREIGFYAESAVAPLPITPEILLKMGFTWIDEENGSMELGYEDGKRFINYYQKWNRLSIETDKAGHGEIDFHDCKYVHDMQRYVYACCDKLMLTLGGDV